MSRRPLTRESALWKKTAYLLFLSVLFLAADSHARAEKLRVAVLGSESTEPVRTLLTAEISKRPDIAVVERAELGKVAGELALQTGGFNSAAENRVGQLLHADALLILTPDPARQLLTMRMVAVAPGAVLFQDSIRFPVPGPAEWTAIAAKKLSPYLGTLSRSGTPRIPLSILRIRSVTGGWASDRQENELGFLLSHRLINEPSLLVLERSHMGALEWEKALQANPSAYWTGSYLLDGSLTSDSSGLAVSARLRSAKLGTDITLSARGKDMRQLVDALASQVTASLKIDRPAAPWDPTAEARQFYEEALWAFRWELSQEASEASESAWALGLRNDTLALLRFQSEVHRLGSSLVFDLVEAPEKPEPWALESASVALDRLLEGLSWKGKDLPEAWVGLGAGCLWECSLVLRGGYYNLRGLQPTETEALGTLRSQIRSAGEILKPAAEKFPLPRVTEKTVGFKPSAHQAPLDSLYAVRGMLGSLWQEDSIQSIRQMKLTLDEIDRLPDNARFQLKNHIIRQNGATITPWIVSWNRGKRLPFTTLRDALLKAPVSAERPIDVACLMLWRNSHLFPDSGSTETTPQQALAGLTEIQNALWNAREAFAKKEISPEYFVSVTSMIHSLEYQLASNHATTTTEGLTAFRVKFFKYIVGAYTGDSYDLQRYQPDTEKLTDQDKQELLPVVRAALKRETPNHVPSGYLTGLADRYTPGWKEIPLPVTPVVPPRAAGEFLRPTWTVSEAQLTSGAPLGDTVIRYRQGRVYVLAKNRGVDAAKFSYRLFIFDPKTGRTSTSPFPGRSVGSADLDAGNGRLFITDGTKVSRAVAGEASWSEFPLSEMEAPKLFLLDDMLYVAGSPGILVRLDAATGRSEVLVSSRRRPALNNLDDQPAFEINKVYKDSKGKLCLLLDYERIYRQGETPKSWQEVVSMRRMDLGPNFDRRVVQGAIGPDGLESQGTVIQSMGRNPAMAVRAFFGMLAADKTKVMPAAMPAGGPPPGLPTGADSAVFDGTGIWLLTIEATGQRHLLKRISAAGDDQQSIPLELGGQGMSAPTRMTAGPDGLFIYRLGKGYFFDNAALASWRQATPAAAKAAR